MFPAMQPWSSSKPGTSPTSTSATRGTSPRGTSPDSQDSAPRAENLVPTPSATYHGSVASPTFPLSTARGREAVGGSQQPYRRAPFPPPRTCTPNHTPGAAAPPESSSSQVVAAAASPQPPPPMPVPELIPRPQLLMQQTWTRLNDFCGSLCKKLKKPYEFDFEELPALSEDVSEYSEIYRQVAHIMGHMDRLLKTPEHRHEEMHGVAKLFRQAMESLLVILHRQGDMSVPCNITEVEMLKYLSDAKYKELLAFGYEQLVVLHNTIGDCMLKMLSPKKAC